MNGLLLVNLGTPDAPTVPAVRRYLREFLWDHRVIDLPAPARALLLYGVILPFRPRRSAAAYARIWTAQGSPLALHSQALREAVAARLGQGWRVALAMRYGQPSIQAGLDTLAEAGATRIAVLPLYPQYASATTGSTLERVFALASSRAVVPALSVIPAFYAEEGWLEAQAALAAPAVAEADHVLFSFHGVPERQIRVADAQGRCLTSPDCCLDSRAAAAGCYRAQCLATARLLAVRLGLPTERFTVSFQSRLGRTPWLQPYTEPTLAALAQAGARRLAVICPSFVSDCLETLEEIGLHGRQTFLSAGGTDFALVPCVNADADWADAVAALARKGLGLSNK